MDRRGRPRRATTSAATASMAALAAAAAAGEGAENGAATPPMDDDVKTEAPDPGSLTPPTPAVPVSARRAPAANGGGGGPSCQADRCGVDLTDAQRYHKRHKVCRAHASAPVVIVAGLQQRFCQQCSRFHELSEFDDVKRSCRLRLAGHNQRRRKSPADSSDGSGGGSSGGGAGSAGGGGCRHADQGGRFPGNPPLIR